MLEVSKKKMITTRKAHCCHYCNEVILKGEQAVAASAKEDDKHVNLHFHIECSARQARELRSVSTSIGIDDFSVTKLPDDKYPF